MKTIKDYKKLNYRMDFEFEPEDGVYVVKFPELPGCIAHGETPQKALKEAIAVKNEWLQVALESGWDLPEPEKPSEVSGRITFRPPKYLHEKILRRSKTEGTSINQLLISFIAEGLERRKSIDMTETLIDQNREFNKLAGLLRTSLNNNSIFNQSGAWGFPHVSDRRSKTQHLLQNKDSKTKASKENGIADLFPSISQGVR